MIDEEEILDVVFMVKHEGMSFIQAREEIMAILRRGEKGVLDQVVGRREATGDNVGAMQGPPSLDGRRCPKCKGWGLDFVDCPDGKIDTMNCPECKGTGERSDEGAERPANAEVRDASPRTTNNSGGETRVPLH
ncbi:MAG: hypothetical protein AAGJ81_01560 [Verrucomicrobiota bacterium]